MFIMINHKFNVYDIDGDRFIIINDIKTAVDNVVNDLYKYDNDVSNLSPLLLEDLKDRQQININNRIYDAINFKSFKYILNNKIHTKSDKNEFDKMEFNKARQIYLLIDSIETNVIDNNTNSSIKQLQYNNIALLLAFVVLMVNMIYSNI